MARVLGLIFGLLFGLVLFVVGTSSAHAAPRFLTQAEAHSYCLAHMNAPPTPPWCGLESFAEGTGVQCSINGVVYPGMINSNSDYRFSFNGGSDTTFWCVPATCSAHDSGSVSQQWGGVYSDGTLYCNDGCMSIFHMNSGIGSLQFANGDGGSWGHFVGNGNRCTSSTDASLFKASSPAPSLCDHGSSSCYNPTRGFCATSQSGEVYCEPAPPPGSGACAVGATGASCVGNGTPPPAPPNPPISSGSPPSSAGTATATDSGGTTNNYTTNNYSGTSPGGGSPASGSSSGGTGSQSNTGGSGNTRPPGTTSGTDSTGKCADGSVPTASGCSGTATDAGCNTPPQCYGDAVMCGQFKEQVAIRCATQKTAAASASSAGANYGDPSAALGTLGVPADGGASGDPSTSGLVTSTDVGQDGFDSSGLGMARTCPANPSFSFQGHTFELDLTPFCSFATTFGWFVLLISFLVGLRIVATGKA